VNASQIHNILDSEEFYNTRLENTVTIFLGGKNSMKTQLYASDCRDHLQCHKCIPKFKELYSQSYTHSFIDLHHSMQVY